MRVAFLGLGRMGAAMAAHVRDAGHDLKVWNRTPKPFDGATVAETVADAVRDAEVVITMLFDPTSVQAVLAEVVDTAPAGTLVVDATTVGPQASRDFAVAAEKGGLRFVDAPVLGSVPAAAAGTLTVLAGGRDEDVAAARPLLELWGDAEQVRHVGPVGAGSALKLVVNQGTGIAAAALGEALGLARRLGVEQDEALDVLELGAFGWTLARKRAAIEAGDFDDAAFTVDGLAKDLGLVVEAGGESRMPVTATARDIAYAAAERGNGDADYAAVIAFAADHRRG